MARYIDAELLEKELSAGCMPIYEKGISGIFGDELSIKDYIDVAPAADVRPERHGEWFGTVCTACGTSVSFYYDCNYCPNCGAKMDRKDSKEND